MRVLIGGVIAVTLAAAAWAAVAVAIPPGYPSGPYQIYILDTGVRQSTFAIAKDDLATAALVENCAGRLLGNAHALIADIRARAERERQSESDDFNVIWVSGEGSQVNLGDCEDHDEVANAHDQADSLVVVSDASAAQVRRIIGQIDGISAADRRTMVEELGLARTARPRR